MKKKIVIKVGKKKPEEQLKEEEKKVEERKVEEPKLEEKREERKEEKKEFAPYRKQFRQGPKIFGETKIQKEALETESKLRDQVLREIKSEEKREKKRFAVPNEITIPPAIQVGELAKKLNIKATVLLEKLLEYGVQATINDSIDADTATLLANEFGCETVKVHSIYDEVQIPVEPSDPSRMVPRPPVVTVMGHVDHGKTTLLDAIRNTNVAAQEAGGITQHIGASVVETKEGKKIVFIDTPGHEAFTAMRARGAQVTDIVVLVVAADDGVMPQTIEAINHAKEANVPIIVAINKIDVPGAEPERVKNQLTKYGLIPEEWGGDTLFVEVSALKKKNIDKLLEAILLQAELMDLKADPGKKGVGVVLESRKDPGKGDVFTVIIKEGTVKVGDPFVVGVWSGRVRALIDDKGRMLKQAGPSMPVEVVGAEGLPTPGDPFNVVDSEEKAKEIAEKRQYLKKLEASKKSRGGETATLEDISQRILEGEEVKELKLIVKADVHGTAEAIKNALERLSTPEILVKVIHYGVGKVTENDVMLASASKASILAFRTKPDPRASSLAEEEGVPIKRYSVIYNLLDDIKQIITGMKPVKYVEEKTGTAEILKVFKIKGVGNVAGCIVKEGTIHKTDKVRIYRDGNLIFEGEILNLKRFKNDVEEVSAGTEFGISFKNFDKIKEGDIIEAFRIVEQQK